MLAFTALVLCTLWLPAGSIHACARRRVSVWVLSHRKRHARDTFPKAGAHDKAGHSTRESSLLWTCSGWHLGCLCSGHTSSHGCARAEIGFPLRHTPTAGTMDTFNGRDGGQYVRPH